MTTHAYIADLSRERRSVAIPTGATITVNAVVAVCGAWERAGTELRCFGLRRLAEVWGRMGQHVDCPACRAEVRRLLGERTDSAHEARIAALTEWVEARPPRGSEDTLKAEAQRRRRETRRRKARAERAVKGRAVA